MNAESWQQHALRNRLQSQLIFAPSFSALAQLALSRVREYDADLNAAAF